MHARQAISLSCSRAVISLQQKTKDEQGRNLLQELRNGVKSWRGLCGKKLASSPVSICQDSDEMNRFPVMVQVLD